MSTTHLADIIKAVQTRFKAQVTANLVKGEVVLYDNLADDLEVKPSDQNPWIHVTVLHGDSNQVTFGSSSRRSRDNGLIIAMVNVPRSKGKARAYEIADIIRTGFSNKHIVNIIYRTVSLTRVGPNGKWWQLNVQCPFQADDIS